MKVKILLARVMVPDQQEMFGGMVYDVSDELGSALVERDQAVEVKPSKESTDESSKPASKKVK